MDPEATGKIGLRELVTFVRARQGWGAGKKAGKAAEDGLRRWVTPVRCIFCMCLRGASRCRVTKLPASGSFPWCIIILRAPKGHRGGRLPRRDGPPSNGYHRSLRHVCLRMWNSFRSFFVYLGPGVAEPWREQRSGDLQLRRRFTAASMMMDGSLSATPSSGRCLGREGWTLSSSVRLLRRETKK